MVHSVLQHPAKSSFKTYQWGSPEGAQPPWRGVWTGHMVDGCSETWWTHLSMLGIVPEVKLGDLMSGEEDVPDSIVSCRPNSH